MFTEVHVGDIFGRLKVIGTANKRGKNRGQKWLCECDCGNQVEVLQDNLRRNHTRSCNCLQRERAVEANLRHGHNRRGLPTSIYTTWSSMIGRCTNPKDTAFVNYGGRGIAVCKRWRNSFEAFLADMGERPKGKFIDRKNNDLGYFPKNCHWVTRKESSRNTRKNRMLTWNGKTQCLAAWAEELGLSMSTLRSRLRSGWTVEKALMSKSQNKKWRK